MKVCIFKIKTTDGDRFGLATPHGRVLHYSPNNWKTINGAKRWAVNNGYTVKEK